MQLARWVAAGGNVGRESNLQSHDQARDGNDGSAMEGVRQPPLHQQSKYGKQWKSDAGTRRGASLCVGVRLTNRAAPGEELPYSTAALAPMVPLAKSSLGSAAARPWGWGGSAPQAQNNFACRKIGISTTLGASHGNRRAHGPGRRISWWPGGYGIQKRRSYGVPSIGPASPVWGGGGGTS